MDTVEAKVLVPPMLDDKDVKTDNEHASKSNASEDEHGKVQDRNSPKEHDGVVHYTGFGEFIKSILSGFQNAFSVILI